MTKTIKRLFKEENGQGLMEYALVLVCIAVVCAGVLVALGQVIIGLYDVEF